ncbi:hypothetical protein F4861DRAFT_500685 [Xylaria intraflava]|nr:hypothetical protein F4861DRAFT_500685 [Xylaria intraflava]
MLGPSTGLLWLSASSFPLGIGDWLWKDLGSRRALTLFATPAAQLVKSPLASICVSIRYYTHRRNAKRQTANYHVDRSPTR